MHLVLSFDCDTDEDIVAAPDVHERLGGLGIKPVYAVPGELLERGAGVYETFARDGCEFINHGQREHTYFDDQLGRHASCFFYDTLPQDVVRNDVTGGDATIRRVLAIAPEGFRTPHFGTYQRPDQLRYLHGLLDKLGYRFSTSTTPLWGLRFGPVFSRFMPVSPRSPIITGG